MQLAMGFLMGFRARKGRQLCLVSAGNGKSRIAAIAALIFLLNNPKKRAHFVFSTEHLMKRDRDDFADLWSFVGERVEYHFNLLFSRKPNDLLIFDEADFFYLNPELNFERFTKNQACICLTATEGGGKDHSAEQSIKERLDFKVVTDPLNPIHHGEMQLDVAHNALQYILQ